MWKPFLAAATAAVLAVLIVSSGSHADTPTGGGGLTRVIHDGTLNGSGTTSNPLSVVSSGSITGTGTNGRATRWTGTSAIANASAFDDGTVFTPQQLAGTVISPTAITGATNDWNPTGLSTATIIRVAVTTTASLSGIVAPTSSRVLVLHNIGSGVLSLLNDTTSTAANRLYATDGRGNTTITVDPDRSVILVYDLTTARWRMVAYPAFNSVLGASCSAGQFVSAITSSTGGGTCTAETGDISGVTANSPLSGGGTSGAVTVGMANGDRGDISLTTAAQTGETWTIDNDVVSYAKMQNVSATNRLLCRVTAGAGDMEECTGTQATSMLDTFATGATTKGVVSGSNGATTSFLRGDNTWTLPPGTPSGITATLSASVNDWSPAGFSSTTTAINITSTSSGPFSITGISSSGRSAGSYLIITNTGGNTLQLSNETTSTTANQIMTGGAVTRSLGNYGSALLEWNGTKWVEIAEVTRYAPELYSTGALHVDGASDLIGTTQTYGNTIVGDASGDALTVNATASFQAAATMNSTLTVSTGQVADIKGRAQIELLSGVSTPGTPTSCGTTPSIDADSTNLAGSFATGSGTTACTITFTATWPVRPWCMVTKNDGTVLAPSNITDGVTTLVLAGLSASTTYRYWCTGGH